MSRIGEGEVVVNYTYQTGHNITFRCDGEPDGLPCSTLNENVDVDLERGEPSAYGSPFILYGSYGCAVCGHEHDYEVPVEDFRN